MFGRRSPADAGSDDSWLLRSDVAQSSADARHANSWSPSSSAPRAPPGGAGRPRVVVDRNSYSSAWARAGYGSSVELRLPFPPLPEHMANHAHHLVGVVQRIDGVVLDYTVDSLRNVDELLGGFHSAGDDADQMAETLFQFGAYIGEVAVRHASGRWIVRTADGAPSEEWPMVQLPSLRLVNPIGKAFNRVRNGPIDAIPYFYTALVEAS